MKELGNGYILQMIIGGRFAVIDWTNGSNKFCGFRLDLESGDWIRTEGNHNKRLPEWVIKDVSK